VEYDRLGRQTNTS